MNFFEIFGFPVSFFPDPDALRTRFYKNSKQYHPDFFTLADAGEQARALELATLNNEAFRTLSDRDKRIRYILELNGLLGNENEPLPQDFLVEVMELNENLMELEFDFDAQRLADTRQVVEALNRSLDQAIEPILKSWTAATGTREQLLPVRDYYLKKRYLLRIQENLNKFAAA